MYGKEYHINNPLPSANFCLSHYFIAVKRHHDQGHVYKIKHLIRGLLTVSEGWSIAQWQGYGRSMGTLMALGQHLRITSWLTGREEEDTGRGVGFLNLRSEFQQGHTYKSFSNSATLSWLTIPTDVPVGEILIQTTTPTYFSTLLPRSEQSEALSVEARHYPILGSQSLEWWTEWALFLKIIKSQTFWMNNRKEWLHIQERRVTVCP